MTLMAVVLAAMLQQVLTAPEEPLQGSLFFTGKNSKNLVRLDHCSGGSCSAPVPISTGLETYGGLLPWNGSLVAALGSHHVVVLDPWCKDSSCPVSILVDVDKALGPGDHGSFNLADMTWCQGSLFIVYGGTSGATGVLRCAGCVAGQDCTSGCSVVDGGAAPGNGTGELSGFVAGVDCLGERVLVADNQNFRVQAIPASCQKAPCAVETFATGLKWPLGVAAVASGARVLVSLDENITSLGPDGTLQHSDWSSREDTGFLIEGGGKIFAISGGDGNVVSFDPICEGPKCTETLVWNSTGCAEKSVGPIAFVPHPQDVAIFSI
mmetsp:Transcript_62150/g.115319  ORF Transcript_62150/g.115319 Transcript_62150/m.115319 type:complete len:323 (+) Transcript_62150:115-1083(+)